MNSSNHYQTLEVNHQATQQEIKQSYRRLVKKFHPDSRAEQSSHDRIIEINAAYEVLGDPQKRSHYDHQLCLHDELLSARRRADRTAAAQNHYQSYRAAQQDGELHLQQWYKNIYLPLNRLLSRILKPLHRQIEQLSGDPFDDGLMAAFQGYVHNCRQYLNQAKMLFSSQPNPAKLARVAALLYHCLNHISDGIEELELFTLNYDDRCLHTGQELFSMARRLKTEAQQTVSHYF
jgi:molecular chaperone DnaJ